jgi:hypothetical protein
MKYDDVGRYKAGCYDILKVIFKQNLKLFGQTGIKKLLFVVRDFNFRLHPRKTTEERIKGDLEKIWSTV